MSLCKVCNHHHEDGVKCSICGHVGKCKVLQLLKNRRPINQLQFVSFQVNVHDNPYRGNWSFARLLRERNFGQVPDAFDTLDVTTCHHALTFVGDAPVAAARWSFTQQNGVDIALIEKLGVIDIRRNRKYGSYTLRNTLEDIMIKMQLEGRTVFTALAIVPQDVAAYKTFTKCGFGPTGEPFIGYGGIEKAPSTRNGLL